MKITIENDELFVELKGLEKIWALKWHLRIPIEEIVEVHVESSAEDLKFSMHRLRLPGTDLPGVIRAGSYLTKDGWEFWSVHTGQTVLVIETSQKHYRRLYLGISSREETEALQKEIQEKTPHEVIPS